MRFFALVLAVILVAGLAACNFSTPSVNTATTTYNYIYTPSETSSSADETLLTEWESEVPLQETTSVLQETTSVLQEATTVIQETTAVAPETTTLAPETTVPVGTTAVQESTTKKVAETTSASSDLTLNVSVPEANGTMEVDLSENNKYTQIVVSKRGIDASLLVAVYSVPESGQNYVFEFSSAGAENRTVENLRRVYLIDSSGKITYVAAASSSEAENVSVVENWFNMNVLIKGMIFPAIEDRLK